MVAITPPGAVADTLVQEFADFTGGLNLISDNFKLLPNESPFMLNVDVSERGGLARRKGWNQLATWGQSKDGAHWGEVADSTYSHRVVLRGDAVDPNTLWYWDGGANMIKLLRNGSVPGPNEKNVVDPAVVATDSSWTPEDINWAVFKGIGYGTRWSATPQTSIKYDPSGVQTTTASSVTVMTDPATTAWQNDYDTPSGAHMPMARYAATHNSAVWVAYTRENGTNHPNRVRWSHPGNAGSWRQDDYIDILEGEPGDRIVGIAPFRDHLVVFKKRTIHAIFGFSPDTFSVVTIANHVGAVGQNAVEVTPNGVFFYDQYEGVFVWDGQQVRWLFEKLEPAIRSGQIINPGEARLGLLDHRLWVSVKWFDAAAPDSGRIFVWDPTLNAWTMYGGFSLDGGATINNYAKNVFMYTNHGGTSAIPVIELSFFAIADISLVTQVDVEGTYSDVLGGAGAFTVDSVYRTPWIDMGDPARDKRWRRPQFIMSGGFEQTTLVDVYKDWNSASPYKTLTLTTEAAGDEFLWDAENWDQFTWSQTASLFDVVLRGGAIGSSGRSLALQFRAPINNNTWDMNAFMITWRNKRLKG